MTRFCVYPLQVLPALMNEYRTPEMNVQNGVLKSLSFLFEYIQEMGKVCVRRAHALPRLRAAPLLHDHCGDKRRSTRANVDMKF